MDEVKHNHEFTVGFLVVSDPGPFTGFRATLVLDTEFRI